MTGLPSVIPRVDYEKVKVSPIDPAFAPTQSMRLYKVHCVFFSWWLQVVMLHRCIVSQFFLKGCRECDIFGQANDFHPN